MLPKPFLLVQKADRAGDVIELIVGEALGEFSEVKGRLLDHSRDLFGKPADRVERSFIDFTIGLAAEIIRESRGVRISIGDALVALLWNSFRDRCVDAD